MNFLYINLLLFIVSCSATSFISPDLTSLDSIWHLDRFFNSTVLTENFCSTLDCREPVSKGRCPPGTIYVQDVVQFGCCPACVQFRGDGEDCTGTVDPYSNGPSYFIDENKVAKPTVSKISSDITDENYIKSLWCDYYLYCTQASDGVSNPFCVPDDRLQSCVAIQRKYDTYLNDPSSSYISYRDEYLWRPECLPDGTYKPKQCKGSQLEEQTCMCVDPDGNTINGKAFPWQGDFYTNMNCLCSRLVYEQTLAGQVVTTHCKGNGNFEDLQCAKGWCHCVNETTGKFLTNLVPEASITLLPCYNETLDGSIYLRRCDSEYEANVELSKKLSGHSMIYAMTLLSCDLDGSYSARQCEGVTCHCTDKYNNYLVPSEDDSDCNCIRDVQTYTESGYTAEFSCDTSIPGQYPIKQTIGNTVFCSDSDGIRISSRISKECSDIVNCDAAFLCLLDDSYPSACDDVCPNCVPEVYFYNDDFDATLEKCTSFRSK